MNINFKNPIWVAGEINNKDFYINFTKRFSDMISQTKDGEEITVFINSGGGETNTALGIFDLLSNCKRKVIGVVTGIAYSGASLILQACQKRIMTKNSTLMLHKSAVTISGSVDNAQEALNTFRNLDQKYYEIYASKSGEKVEKIADMAHKDKYFSAKEALEASLIDEII